MPDTFKILHESFSEPLPVTEDDGFQDFNALSRIVASEPGMTPEIPPGRPVMSERPTMSRKLTEEVPVFSGNAGTVEPPESVIKSSPERAHPLINQATPAPQAGSASAVHVSSPGKVPAPNSEWRDLPLGELFSRLRSGKSAASEPPKRLHGMFRR